MSKYFLFAFFILTVGVSAQETKQYINWQAQDPETDKVFGTGMQKAYELLQGRPAREVIVAVIDGGTDIKHEDLQGNIWTNAGEIPDNGIDDDHNGYVDDIHGWNFLGGKNGNIAFESTELARIYHRLYPFYGQLDSAQVPPSQLAEYREFCKVRTKFMAEQTQSKQQLMVIAELNNLILKVKKENNGVLSRRAVKKYKPENDREKAFKRGLKLAMLLSGKPAELEKEIGEGTTQLQNLVKFNDLNTDSIRQAVVGDNPNNPSERYYGNNDVIGPDALHGTHVAGIIGAMRNNGKGMNGLADHVKLMIVRAVPDGDERDKDVANAIRYAVDNHASVINMSFGKYYSPFKAVVDSAIKYAEDHDVLMIHAGGNESKNKDVEESYPVDESASGVTSGSWIEVGANDRLKGKKLLGSFSNYGKKHLDLFAPGVDIYSTGPNNTYVSESGTSMAAPVTTGVAAMIRSYFPELKASEVKELLMKTVTKYPNKVSVPGTKKDTAYLSEISVSGGIVNGYNAVRYLLKK